MLYLNKKLLRLKGLKKSKKVVFIVVVGIVIIGLLTVGTVRKRENDKLQLAKWCASNYQKEQNYIYDKSWSQAKEIALDRFNKCKNIFTNAEQFISYYNLALASYMTNNKEEAKSYSDRGLGVYDRLTDDQRTSLKHAADMVYGLIDIKRGIYQDLPKAQGRAKDKP